MGGVEKRAKAVNGYSMPKSSKETVLRYLQGLEVVQAGMQHQEASFGIFSNMSILSSL